MYVRVELREVRGHSYLVLWIIDLLTFILTLLYIATISDVSLKNLITLNKFQVEPDHQELLV